MASRRSSSDDSNDAKEPAETSEVTNVFRNDGSFLEMFKKMQKATQFNGNHTSTAAAVKQSVPVETTQKNENNSSSVSTSSKSAPIVGRRRYAKILPVGKVKKLKSDGEENKASPTDAWAKYLEEVKRYKETYCDSEAKNRSLVK